MNEYINKGYLVKLWGYDKNAGNPYKLCYLVIQGRDQIVKTKQYSDFISNLHFH